VIRPPQTEGVLCPILARSPSCGGRTGDWGAPTLVYVVLSCYADLRAPSDDRSVAHVRATPHDHQARGGPQHHP